MGLTRRQPASAPARTADNANVIPGGTPISILAGVDMKSRRGVGANRRTAKCAGGGGGLGALLGALVGAGKGAAGRNGACQASRKQCQCF